MNNPTPDQVKKARESVGYTQAEAAACTMTATRTWQAWEGAGSNARGMPPGLFELFLIKTGQKPLTIHTKGK